MGYRPPEGRLRRTHSGGETAETVPRMEEEARSLVGSTWSLMLRPGQIGRLALPCYVIGPINFYKIASTMTSFELSEDPPVRRHLCVSLSFVGFTFAILLLSFSPLAGGEENGGLLVRGSLDDPHLGSSDVVGAESDVEAAAAAAAAGRIDCEPYAAAYAAPLSEVHYLSLDTSLTEFLCVYARPPGKPFVVAVDSESRSELRRFTFDYLREPS
jgi:hypothetical protein